MPPTKPSGMGRDLLSWGFGVFLQLFPLASKQGRETLCIHGFLMQQTKKQSHPLLLSNRMPPANKQEQTSSGQQSPFPANVSPDPALLSPWETGNTSGVKIVPVKSAAAPARGQVVRLWFFVMLYLFSLICSKLC